MWAVICLNAPAAKLFFVLHYSHLWTMKNVSFEGCKQWQRHYKGTHYFSKVRLNVQVCQE